MSEPLRARSRFAEIEVLRSPGQRNSVCDTMLDRRGSARLFNLLARLPSFDAHFEAVLLASSLSKSVANTCLALPTWGTALAWSRLEGVPTTIMATIPIP